MQEGGLSVKRWAGVICGSAVDDPTDESVVTLQPMEIRTWKVTYSRL